MLLSKQNKVGTTVVSQYDYSVNPLGQRTNVSTSGTAFPATPSWAWGYNSKGEVVKADSSNNIFDRAYQFDGIGNRLRAATGSIDPNDAGAEVYSPNALNQYTAINALNPAYDFDGNMTSGPLSAAPSANSTWVWDAENRLIETQVGTSGPLVRCLYDSQSRRIAKTVGADTTVYVYDGWNVIAEYQGAVGVSPTVSKTHLWGSDLSGSMQGAGGVGGLLSTTVGTSGSLVRYYPTFDGNGNVSEYLDNTGAVTAHFEYDPFGRTIVDTDSNGQFRYRFSTKPEDSETGLYYYGYRYYDPNTGRWPSRDPIEEEGGINLYGFVGNDGVSAWDWLGAIKLSVEDSIGLGLQVGAKAELEIINTNLPNWKIKGQIKFFAGIGIGYKGNFKIGEQQFGFKLSFDGPQISDSLELNISGCGKEWVEVQIAGNPIHAIDWGMKYSGGIGLGPVFTYNYKIHTEMEFSIRQEATIRTNGREGSVRYRLYGRKKIDAYREWTLKGNLGSWNVSDGGKSPLPGHKGPEAPESVWIDKSFKF